tara:strand:+ start:102 stop:542 length:441 start_codon:yes stop_codon:yes gene_type:complete
MTSSIYTDITRWIKKVSEVHEKLGNHSMCPFAKNARYHIIQASALDVDPVLIRKEVCIFIVPDKITKSRLQNYCKKISKKYPEYIFLPDHRKANTKMGGMSTGNGKYNLVLAQKRKPLTMARQSLQKNTSYYDNLSKKYKKELWSF